MQYRATPEEIRALGEGEIVISVPMEPQPREVLGIRLHGCRTVADCRDGPSDRYYNPCPVEVGDTIETVCSECNGTAVDKQQHYLLTCHCREAVIRPTVHAISHRQADGVHYWNIVVGKETGGEP